MSAARTPESAILAKRAIAAVDESEARFRLVQDLSPNGFALLEPVRDHAELEAPIVDFLYAYVNVSGARFFELEPEAMIGRTLRSLLSEAASNGIVADYERVIRTGDYYHREQRYHAAGYDLHFSVTAVRVGEQLGVTFIDITARTRAEREREALMQNEASARARAERLQRLAVALARALTPSDVAHATLAEGVALLGATVAAFHIEIGDARQLLARYEHGVTGRTMESGAFPRLDVEVSMCADARDPVRLLGTLGVSFPTALPLHDERHADLATIATLAGQSLERARLYEAELEARANAEAANRAKSEFLAVMSHELRTPLNAIGGYASLMELGLRGPVTDEQRTDLARMQTSQKHLLRLIDEVLNFVKLETGSVRYDFDQVRLRDVLAATETLISPQLSAREIALTVDDCPDDMVARADAERLKQILVNLVSNAIKFTAPGGRIDVVCQSDECNVKIAVRDTGIGIPADKLDSVFEPFVQIRSELARNADGTGLGLSISRDLVRGMGGELHVASVLGEGSTFTVVLPCA